MSREEYHTHALTLAMFAGAMLCTCKHSSHLLNKYIFLQYVKGATTWSPNYFQFIVNWNQTGQYGYRHKKQLELYLVIDTRKDMALHRLSEHIFQMKFPIWNRCLQAPPTKSDRHFDMACVTSRSARPSLCHSLGNILKPRAHRAEKVHTHHYAKASRADHQHTRAK